MHLKCPFTGKICLFPKTVKLTKQDDENASVTHLCHSCADQYLSNSDIQAIDTTSQTKLLPNGEIESKLVSSVKNIKKLCPKCNASYDEILNKEKEGCDICHGFHNIITTMGTPVEKPLISIQALKRKLDIAIAKEDYESAALLRDAIENLDKRTTD